MSKINFQRLTNENIIENKLFLPTIEKHYKNNRKGIAYIVSCGGIGNAFLGAISGLYIAYKLNMIPIISSHLFHCGNLEFIDAFTFNRNKIFYGRDLNTQKICNFLNIPEELWKYTNGCNSKNYCWIRSGVSIEHHVNCIKEYIDKQEKETHICLNGNGWPDEVDYNTVKEMIKYYDLKINEELLQKAMTFIKDNKISEKTLGCHWRGTDSWSKTSWGKVYPGGFVNITHFIECIKKVYRDYNNCFVCSGDEESEKKIIKQISNCFYYNKKHYTNKTGDDWKELDRKGDDKYNVYRSKEACQEAFIDCIILGKTCVLQKPGFPLPTLEKKGAAGSSFIQLGIFIHTFFKELKSLPNHGKKGPVRARRQLRRNIRGIVRR